jgi:hypothetical protein
MTWETVLLGAIGGLISGVLLSVVGPRVKWNIEKRRFKLTQQQEALARWRKEAHEVASKAYMEDVFHLPVIRELWPHLNPKQQLAITNWEHNDHDHARKVSAFLIDTVARIANEWGHI